MSFIVNNQRYDVVTNINQAPMNRQNAMTVYNLVTPWALGAFELDLNSINNPVYKYYLI